MRRRKRKSLVKRVLHRIVKKVKRKIGNKKFYKKGLRTKKLNSVHVQRGGFSL